MVLVENYLNDGAGSQARAVLAFVSNYLYGEDIYVNRWYNGREQGYVLHKSGFRKNENNLKNDYIRLNIAFFEHRNSDQICALKWEAFSYNDIVCCDNANFPEGFYESKWDLSHEVGYGEIIEMTHWIKEQFDEFTNGLIKENIPTGVDTIKIVTDKELSKEKQ